MVMELELLWLLASDFPTTTLATVVSHLATGCLYALPTLLPGWGE